MSDPGVFLFNPLPWDRELSGRVPPNVRQVRGVDTDPTASRHFQDRGDDYVESEPSTDASYLPPTTVPGFGYRVVPADALVSPDSLAFDERATVETDRYVVEFDRDRGGIARWYDRTLDHEWVDPDADYPLGGFVHEAVADRSHDDPRKLLYRQPEGANWQRHASGFGQPDRSFQADWHAERRGADAVERHRVYETPLGIDVRQRLAAPGVDSPVELQFLLPHGREEIVVSAHWRLGTDTHPEATYLAFPFALDDPTPRVDVGGAVVEPGRDQLDGSCHDYYTAQQWVDVSDAERGVTVATPLNPLVQFGDFSFAAAARDCAPDDALVLGWVTNNYWETNFRARQPGLVTARYHLSPHGSFDPARAYRVGSEAEHWDLLAQTAAEPPAAAASLPATASLLDLPSPPALVSQVRPGSAPLGVPTERADPWGEASELFVVVRNAADEPTTATIEPGALTVTAAEPRSVLGVPAPDRDDEITLEDGTVSLSLGANDIAAVALETTVSPGTPSTE